MKTLVCLCLFSMCIMLQNPVKITHHRKDLKNKKWIANKDFSIVKQSGEDNMDMINRGYDTVKHHAKKLNADWVFVNGRRWRYMGRKLVIITELYENN